MKQINVILLILFFGFTNCQNNQEEIEVPTENTVENDWKTHKTDIYSIAYPSKWNFVKPGQMGTEFMIMTKLDSKEDDFRENVNLMIQNLTGKNIDLNKFVEISIKQASKFLTEGKVILSERKIKNGLEYQEFIMTSKTGVYDLKTRQFCFIKNEKAYILTFTSLKNTYDKYSEVGSKILDSFVLK